MPSTPPISSHSLPATHLPLLPSFFSSPPFPSTLSSTLSPSLTSTPLTSSPSTTGTPTLCLPGTYGALSGQSSISTCSPCKRSFYCQYSGMTNGTICPINSYCPQGTVTYAAFSCLAGTYSASEGLYSASQCSSCPAGSYCVSHLLFISLSPSVCVCLSLHFTLSRTHSLIHSPLSLSRTLTLSNSIIYIFPPLKSVFILQCLHHFIYLFLSSPSLYLIYSLLFFNLVYFPVEWQKSCSVSLWHVQPVQRGSYCCCVCAL